MQAPPLVDRPADAALFVTPDGIVTAGTFLADVHAMAANLPGAGPILNLCRDRYRFTVAFAAAVTAGRVSLLSGDPSTKALADLAQQYPDHVPVADAQVATGTGPDGPNPIVAGDTLAALVFTSGSTGLPTGHPKTWAGLVARTRAAAQRFGLADAAPAAIVGTVPPGHMYGFEVTVLLPLHAACSSWSGPAFFPGDVHTALARMPGRPILVTTPLQMRALLEAMPARRLHACISATAPLDPALAADAEARWGAPVHEIFGATECGSIASRRTRDGPEWSLYPGVALRDAPEGCIVEAEAMAPVPLADEIERQADGRFVLLGRRADMVKLGGRRASLNGLNRILTELDGVRDGLFIVPDDLDRRSTARLLALVVAPERSASSILAELRGRVDPLFLPRRVVRVAALPRNAMGKLPRQAVMELLAQAGPP